MQESDEILVAWVAEGREDAFRELVQRYEAKARRYCYRIFRDTQVAEDAAQEVFLKLYQNAAKYQPTGPFSTWFYRVLGNLCFDRLRFEKRRAAVRGNTMDSHTMDSRDDRSGHSGNGHFVNPEQALVRKEERLAVRTAVKGLPENLRRALTLREFEGLKYREIAEVMEVSLNEVKVLIHRGRKQLANRLRTVLSLENRS